MIQPSTTSELNRCLLVTGFPYDIRTNPENNLDNYTRLSLRTQGVRRLGSAALDLCYVACGRFDGFWEENLKPWDTAAGALIAQEAGGKLTDFTDNPFNIDGNQILATNGLIHPKMIALLNLKDIE